MLLISPTRYHHSITQQKMYLHWFTLTERKSFLSSVSRLPLSNKKSYCLMISSISDENCLCGRINWIAIKQNTGWSYCCFLHTQNTFHRVTHKSAQFFMEFCGSEHLHHRRNWHPGRFEYLKVVLIPVWHLVVRFPSPQQPTGGSIPSILAAIVFLRHHLPVDGFSPPNVRNIAS